MYEIFINLLMPTTAIWVL